LTFGQVPFSNLKMLDRSSATHPLRVLVIGAGGMASHTHLPLLAKFRGSGEIVLSVVCDTQRERAAAAKKRFGFSEETADAVSALERSDIDAVYIFGSAQMHHEYGALALNLGKHLFVEKPIAPSFALARTLAMTASERGLIAVGGHNRRFFPSFAAAQAEAGRTGWRFIEAIFHKSEYSRPTPFGARTWLTANGIHALDVVVFMMGGLPERIASFAEPVGSAEPRNFSAIMRWRDGCQATFLCDNSAGSRREEYVFHGVERSFSVTAKRLRIESPAGTKETNFNLDAEGFAAEHREFLRAVRGGEEPRHGLATLAPTLYLAELIEDGFIGLVALPDVPEGSRKRESALAISSARQARAGAVLVLRPSALHEALPALASHHRIISLDDVRASPDACTDVCAAIIGNGGGPLPDDVLAKLPQLAVVGIAGLSLRHYGPETLFERGIHVVNASESYARTVAEFALGLALLGRRRAFLSHEIMRSGGWGVAPGSRGFRALLLRTARASRPLVRGRGIEPPLKAIWGATKAALRMPDTGKGGPYALRDFSGVTVGLVGWSANARVFAELLRPFQVKVKVFSEHAADEEIGHVGAQKASLGEVLKADIVSLHRGLTDKTWHCLGAAELALLRPGAVFLNVARGGLVDQTALVARLRRGDIFACLDTYEQEPLPRSHPLRKLHNVFLTSHIAGGTKEMYEAAAREVVEKVVRCLRGEDVKTVSREQWRMMS